MAHVRAVERPARGPWLRLVPERRLAVSLALAAPLWLIPGLAGRMLAVGALVAIAVCVIADMFRLPPARAIGVTRVVPATVGIGDTVDGSYAVAPRWAHALDIHLYDEIPVALRGGVGVATVRVQPHTTGHFDFTLTGMTRGRAALGRVGVRVTTPLGFLAGRHWVSPGDEMLVAPSVTGVRRYRLLAMQHRLDAMGVRALARKGDGQGFAGLRDYALGDDPRHIDWKATARRARLTTREFTIERSQTVFTLIDAGRGMTQLAGEYSRFEHALSAAVVLSDIAATAGDRVGTLVFDDEIRAFVPANRSRGALQAVRDALVPVVATTIEPDYAMAFRFLATHQRKRALVVFFTDVIDLRASQSLMAHVARSAARHLALVVALRNDAIFDAAIPGSRAVAASALYERAAAEELILAREEALERMRRAGVIVLDVSPRVMTSSVINRYLELKARGAI
ncbi:MAG TPA: DUF58 domain-containing protein [Gemmatimonadaceae bacterium]|nr:DUF58 domain-containing protein [Gemmatimonadaceae bacterium]